MWTCRTGGAQESQDLARIEASSGGDETWMRRAVGLRMDFSSVRASIIGVGAGAMFACFRSAVLSLNCRVDAQDGNEKCACFERQLQWHEHCMPSSDEHSNKIDVTAGVRAWLLARGRFPGAACW